VSSKQKVVQGTRTYIAPETIMKQPLSPQTDIYSLGILFFEVLTGVPPFFGASPGDLLAKHVRTVPPLATDFNPNVAGEIAQVVARMLRKKPKDRHQNIQELNSCRKSATFSSSRPILRSWMINKRRKPKNGNSRASTRRAVSTAAPTRCVAN
jgi:serine/threonine-protein kinase